MTERLTDNHFLPDALIPSFQTLRVEYLMSLFGVSVNNPENKIFPSVLRKEIVVASLKRFTDAQMESGEIYERIKGELKDGSELNPSQFRLYSTPYPEFRVRGEDHLVIPFYRDGEYGFILQFSGGEYKTGVIVGFTIIKPSNKNEFVERGLCRDSLKDNDLIIVQLQAKPGETTRKALSHFRWEKVMVGLVASWTRQAGFPRVLLQPAANNKWDEVRNNGYNGAYLHYDVTARRLGFKRNRSDEPYVFYFVSPQLLQQF